jgi:hypothetical protein
MEQLMCTMDECLLVQGPQAVSLELWDEVVAMRVKVGECKQRLQVIYYLCCTELRLKEALYILYSETCIRRNRMGPKIFSTLDKFPHYTK